MSTDISSRCVVLTTRHISRQTLRRGAPGMRPTTRPHAIQLRVAIVKVTVQWCAWALPGLTDEPLSAAQITMRPARGFPVCSCCSLCLQHVVPPHCSGSPWYIPMGQALKDRLAVALTPGQARFALIQYYGQVLVDLRSRRLADLPSCGAFTENIESHPQGSRPQPRSGILTSTEVTTEVEYYKRSWTSPVMRMSRSSADENAQMDESRPGCVISA
jgi:hypothetical protein